MTIDAALTLPLATLRLVRTRLAAPADYVLRAERHMLELCVTPRPVAARGSYHEIWGPHRFERIGDIMLVPAGHALHVKGDSAGPQSAIRCEFHGDELSAWLDAELDWTPARLAACLDISSLAVRQLLRRLATEARGPGPGAYRLCGFLAGQLIIELGRYCEAIGDVPVSGGLAAWRLRLIDERLKDGGAPPLAELASLCRISVRQLTRGFRISRGCSLGDYVAHSRIEHAKRLLDGEQSIKSIARAVGFSSSSSFAHAFQQSTGVTPLQFRRRILGARAAPGA